MKSFSEIRKSPEVEGVDEGTFVEGWRRDNVRAKKFLRGAPDASAFSRKGNAKHPYADQKTPSNAAQRRANKRGLTHEEVEGVEEGSFAGTKGWAAKTTVIDPDKRETERKITQAQVETEKSRKAKKLAQMTANMKGAALKREEIELETEASDPAVQHARADAYGKKFWAKIEKTSGDKVINKLRNTSKAQSNYDKSKGSIKLHAGDQLATEQTADDAADEVAGNKNYMRLKQQRAMFKAKKAKELEKNRPAPLKTATSSTSSVKTEEVKPSPLAQDKAQKARTQKDRIAKLQSNLSSMRSRGMRMGPMVQHTQNQLAKARSRGG